MLLQRELDSWGQRRSSQTIRLPQLEVAGSRLDRLPKANTYS
jgi:hypothetical protein